MTVLRSFSHNSGFSQGFIITVVYEVDNTLLAHVWQLFLLGNRRKINTKYDKYHLAFRPSLYVNGNMKLRPGIAPSFHCWFREYAACYLHCRFKVRIVKWPYWIATFKKMQNKTPWKCSQVPRLFSWRSNTKKQEQECIPVECVPPASVATTRYQYWGLHLPGRCTFRRCTRHTHLSKGDLGPGIPTHPPLYRITEIITFRNFVRGK